MTEKLRVVNTLKNNITKWFGKRMALTKSGKAGIMVKESTDKEGSMKQNIIFMVSLLAFILVSGQTVQAKDYIKILKGIRNANHSIHVAQAALKHPKFKNLIILKQSIDYDKNKRKILIKELLPFFKGNEALSIVEEMEKCENKELYNELSETLYEKVFNETNQNNKVLKRKLKQFITLEERRIAFVEKENYDPYSIWWEGYDLYRAFDCDNAIPKFEEGIKGIKDIIANPPTPDWQPAFSYIQVRSGYLFIGLSYMYKAVPEYEKARKAFNSCINTFPEEIPVMGIESYTCLGRMLQNEGKFTEAIEYYKKASTTEEPWSEAESYWAESLIALGIENYAEALKKINWIIDNVDPHYAEEEGILEAPLGVEAAHYNRAYMLSTEGRIEEAEKDLDKALSYLVYNGTIGPAVVSYIEHYKKLILNLRDEMKISISPNPLYISLGEKATIQATINSANFKDAKFRTENNVLFSVGETITTGNIASAEVTSLAAGNGNIVFEVEVDGKILQKRSKVIIQTPIFFVDDADIDNSDLFSKKLEGIPISAIKKGKNAGPYPGCSDIKVTVYFKTIQENGQLIRILDLWYSDPNMSNFKNLICREKEINSNIYYNSENTLEVIVESEIPSIYSITKTPNEESKTFNMRWKNFGKRVTLKMISFEPLICSNMMYNPEECPDIAFLSDALGCKLRIVFQFPDLKRKQYKFLIRSYEEKDSAPDNSGVLDWIELNAIPSGKNYVLSEKYIRLVVFDDQIYDNNEKVLKVKLPKNPLFTAVKVFLIDENDYIVKEEKVKIFGFGLCINGLLSKHQPAADNILENIVKCGYDTYPFSNTSEKCFGNIKYSDILYFQFHGDLKIVTKNNTKMWTYCLMRDIGEKEEDQNHELVYTTEDFQLIGPYPITPHFTFINACNSAPPKCEGGIQDNHLASKKIALEKFRKVFLKKPGSVYMAWRMFDYTCPLPEGTIVLPENISDGVITSVAVKFAQNFFSSCSQGNSLYVAYESAAKSDPINERYIKHLLFADPQSSIAVGSKKFLRIEERINNTGND